MIPLAVPNLCGREGEYLQECVASTFVSTVGPFVTRFEQMAAAAAGSRQAVATSAGTTGLHAALVAVGVTAGDLVIIPALTFIATANAVAHAGAQPWMLDISADSWTLDPAQLARCLDEQTAPGPRGPVHRQTGRRVAAVVPVYTLGMPADMDAIVSIAARHGLPVVADAAAALGAVYKGRPVGRLGADLSMFSFNGNKTVTAGGGGIVAGEDEALVGLVRHLTTTARVGADYDHDRVGFNYRMTNLQAAVGCAQMENLETFVAKKRSIQALYDAEFAGLPGVGTFPRPDWAEGACWFAGFTVEGDSANLRARLRQRGLDVRPFWKPISLQVPYADAPCAETSVADGLWQRIVTLPCSTNISDSELAAVVAAVHEEIRK